MKKYYRLLTVFAIMLFFNSTLVLASNDIKVMTVHDRGENPILYVKGYEGDINSASALIGNTECPNVSFQKLNDGKFYLDTLILLDNSLSIPEKLRESTKSWILELIADRKPYERFSIATYGEELEMLVDFTDEYAQLRKTLLEIEHKDRDTYLSEVLYDLLNSDSFAEDESGAYRRILVVSDGGDNKNVGYTSDEITSKLTKSGVPVYTIGITNIQQNNGKELSNMYSISRYTKALSATYGTNEMDELLESLKKDRDIVRFEIVPENSVKDGSKKTISLTITGSSTEQVVTVDEVRMKQVAVSEEKEEKILESNTEEIEEKTEISLEASNKIIILVGGIVFVFIIVATLVIILVVRKNRSKSNEIIEIDESFDEVADESKTEMLLHSSIGRDDDDATVYIFNQDRHYTLTLTDIHNPARMYQMSIQDRLVIGRSSKLKTVDLVIDYDPSVSKEQCMIERRGDHFFLVDRQSSNGTFLNNNRVLSEVEVYSGSIIKMGRVEMKIELS